MSDKNKSLAIYNPDESNLKIWEKIGVSSASLGIFILFLALFGLNLNADVFMWSSLALITAGALFYTYGKYSGVPEGIKNTGVWFDSISSKGVMGWALGVILTAFYVLLYWFPAVLGHGSGVNGANQGLIKLFDPLSLMLNGGAASQWFVYGTLYTVLICALGFKFIIKYRHNAYQVIRTIVVMISQFFLAYFIPEILAGLNYNSATSADGSYQGWYDTDIKNTWPLDYDFFNDWHLDAMQAEAYQPVGMTYLWVGILMFLVVTPIVTYFVGKRWYCSWICGCGGLAETAGDNFRQLSSKSLSSWKLERWLIHGVMVFVFVMTAVTLYGYFFEQSEIFGISIYNGFQKPYGFLIGAAFSGVIGVGFYPLLGNRVWCRFGCPMAGYMGIIQRFKSKFRITTNGGQCISCGNCSTYCEQGIDVRAYAQKGENIVRASCVGCGVCSAVCPRGVLKLENGPEEKRISSDNPIVLGNSAFKINDKIL